MKCTFSPQMEKNNTVICVVGARPNYMKMAPIWRAFAKHAPALPVLLVHTGQHYDSEMSERFFKELDLPVPDINLAVGSNSHALQTADIMKKFEPVIDEYKPSCIVVVGDVNSTLACSLVAAKKNIAVMHVEAGLRSFDRCMPEEINRLLTDQLSTRLYITEETARSNLIKEGIDQSQICFSGNVMIDSVFACRAAVRDAKSVLQSYGFESCFLGESASYALVTLHRPSNVDNKDVLESLLVTLNNIAERIQLVFVLHPRTKANIERFGFYDLINKSNIALLPPIGYLDSLGLVVGAKMVLTDSGGLQEETTALGVPCLTLRENTERPITIEQGTNVLVGTNSKTILEQVDIIIQGKNKKGKVPELWDGHAAERIAKDIIEWIHNSPSSIKI